MARINLSDEEAGFLCGILYDRTRDQRFRRRGRKETPGEKAARALAQGIRKKLNHAIGRRAARVIETITQAVIF